MKITDKEFKLVKVCIKGHGNSYSERQYTVLANYHNLFVGDIVVINSVNGYLIAKVSNVDEVLEMPSGYSFVEGIEGLSPLSKVLKIVEKASDIEAARKEKIEKEKEAKRLKLQAQLDAHLAGVNLDNIESDDIDSDYEELIMEGLVAYREAIMDMF